MNDVTKKKKSEVSTNVVDFSGHIGVGFENVGAQEMAIPFLKNMMLSTIIYSAIIEFMIYRYSIKKEILN